jgi:uncharacterized membrane protein YtjA (UPF0391 family)
MKSNLGLTDRVIRVILAIVAAALYFFGITSGAVGLVLLVVGVVLAVTSFINFCPLYAILGITTKTKGS